MSYCYPVPFSFSYKDTSSPIVCQVQLWSLLHNVVVHPKMTHNVCVSLDLIMEHITAKALNSNSQKSLWKYVRNASWATGKAARMCFCGDLDFTNPETGSIRHSKRTLLRLLGIIASILTLLHYEGKAEIHCACQKQHSKYGWVWVPVCFCVTLVQICCSWFLQQRECVIAACNPD